MSDPQRASVYRMERREFRGLWRRVKIPLSYRQRCAKLIFRLYGLPPIPVRSGRNKGFCGLFWHSPDPTEQPCIDLCPDTGQDLLNLAHELAHYMTWVRNPRAQDHGPTFMKHYMLICASLRLVPQAGFREAARRYGLRISK